ncbi:MAG: hypothetical protein AB1391_02535 [Candidatus Micrarchaeota archaeon]
MGIRKVINYTIIEYKKNLWLILIFSVMFVISMFALFFAPMPTYTSLGAVFLRLGSIPILEIVDIVVIIVVYLASLFIFSDAITNINLIIKAKRTLTKISSEVFGGTFKYALKIFLVYTIAMLVVFGINIATFESQAHNLIYPLVSFFVFMAIFFVPPAIVIDDIDSFRAIESSIKALKTKWSLVVMWVIIGLIAITIIEFFSFLILPANIAKYIVIALNCLVLIPLLTIFQTQVYMEKYPLSP